MGCSLTMSTPERKSSCWPSCSNRRTTMRTPGANPSDSSRYHSAADVVGRRGVRDSRSAVQPAEATHKSQRRIYIPGQLLNDDNIDEIANEIVAALQRDREQERG